MAGPERKSGWLDASTWHWGNIGRTICVAATILWMAYGAWSDLKVKIEHDNGVQNDKIAEISYATKNLANKVDTNIAGRDDRVQVLKNEISSRFQSEIEKTIRERQLVDGDIMDLKRRMQVNEQHDRELEMAVGMLRESTIHTQSDITYVRDLCRVFTTPKGK